jgi:hypothetical protein
MILTCPQGLYFDQTKGFCNLEKLVKCEFASTTTTTNSNPPVTTIEPITTIAQITSDAAPITTAASATTTENITKKPLCPIVEPNLGINYNFL